MRELDLKNSNCSDYGSDGFRGTAKLCADVTTCTQTTRIKHRLIGMGVCEKPQADSLADNAPGKSGRRTKKSETHYKQSLLEHVLGALSDTRGEQ